MMDKPNEKGKRIERRHEDNKEERVDQEKNGMSTEGR